MTFSISQVLQIVDVNSMLAHCVATLDTTTFDNILKFLAQTTNKTSLKPRS